MAFPSPPRPRNAHDRTLRLVIPEVVLGATRDVTIAPVMLVETSACALTATQLPSLDAVLRQIAYERRYELYMQGLRWEDTRRLPVQITVTMPYLPLPATECRNNPNAAAACS